MNGWQLLLIGYVGVGGLYWLMQLVLTVRVWRSVKKVEDLPPGDFAAWPRVSLVVTARNEEEKIEAAIHSRQEEGYPNLEIVVVDDRSEDKTGAIAGKMAEGDPRIRVVSITELPEGWLGKLYALHRGAQAATGEWLLFSDADVHYEPGTIRRAVAWGEERGLDQLAVVPSVNRGRFLYDVVMTFFLRLIMLAARPWAVEDPRSKAAMGSGSFNLVRRSAFERTPGFDWIKMETADDAGLGLMLKNSGARCSLLSGVGMVSVDFYGSLGEALRGSERPTFANLGRCRLSRIVVMTLIILLLEIAPLAAFIPARIPGLWLAGAAILGVAWAAGIIVCRWFRRHILPALFYPVAALLQAYAMLRAGILGKMRGGVYWRGTFYSTAQLNAGRRFYF